MHKWDPSRIGLIALLALSAGVAAVVATSALQRGKTHEIVIAAGSAEGESHIIAQALKTVIERHEPKIRVSIRETAGTNENLALLERGVAQFAAAQADVPAGPMARIVVGLYDDVFQVLAHPDSQAKSFPDLKGQRIALRRRGGQFSSFLRLADHFGLREPDFQFVGEDDASAVAAFRDRKADILFNVRALGHPSLTNLVRGGEAKFVPIEQAAAMRISFPAFEPSVIPHGAYLGNPPIPPADLVSVSVKRTLLAHRDLDVGVVRSFTSALMERRQEIADAIPERWSGMRPLLAAVKPPDTQTGLGAAIHPGARDYYDRDKPSFVQQYADFVSLLLTLVLLGGSWLWELKRFVERRQKNNADVYSGKVIAIMNQARRLSSPAELDGLRSQLLDLLTSAVHDLDHDKVSEESFQSFRSILQITLDVIEKRELEVSA